jgi:S1-C subfamily serine protease
MANNLWRCWPVAAVVILACLPLNMAIGAAGDAAAGAAGAKSAHADGSPITWYDRAKAASVEVLIDGHLAGSGWFADAKGLAVTAAHVVGQPGRRVELVSPAAGRVEAQVLAVDRGNDTAVLRAPARDGGYPALAFADRMPGPAAPVFLFGAPVYRHAVLLRGWVARPEVTYEYMPDEACYTAVTHISGLGPIGTSGGPWLDRDGRVIGLQSGLMVVKGAPTGVSFIVPGTAVRRVVESGHTAATPTAGAAFEEMWEHQADLLKRFPGGTQGLIVRAVRQSGPLGKAGVKEFDAVVKADGQLLLYRDDIVRIIRGKRPGDRLTLSVISPDAQQPREVKIELDHLEKAWADQGR